MMKFLVASSGSDRGLAGRCDDFERCGVVRVGSLLALFKPAVLDLLGDLGLLLGVNPGWPTEVSLQPFSNDPGYPLDPEEC